MGANLKATIIKKVKIKKIVNILNQKFLNIFKVKSYLTFNQTINTVNAKITKNGGEVNSAKTC